MLWCVLFHCRLSYSVFLYGTSLTVQKCLQNTNEQIQSNHNLVLFWFILKFVPLKIIIYKNILEPVLSSCL